MNRSKESGINAMIFLLALFIFSITLSPSAILYITGKTVGPILYAGPVLGLVLVTALLSRYWYMRIMLIVVTSVLSAIVLFLSFFYLFVSKGEISLIFIVLITTTIICISSMLMLIYSKQVAGFFSKTMK
jgi:hypothetical protein